MPVFSEQKGILPEFPGERCRFMFSDAADEHALLGRPASPVRNADSAENAERLQPLEKQGMTSFIVAAEYRAGVCCRNEGP